MATTEEPVVIPLPTDLHINLLSGGSISVKGSGITNGVIGKYPVTDAMYVTQRPAFQTFDNSIPATSRGRGVHYWESASSLMIMNNDKVYAGSYGGSTSTITAGYRKVFTDVLNGKLFIIDPENNSGYYMTNSTTLANMTGGSFTSFPPNNSLTLAGGVAVLDRTMYVMSTNGRIWGSALNDGATWTDALNVVTCEAEEDGGVFITKHHNNVVGFGRRTTQFFYDAANATGSPLSARTDLMYTVGCAERDAVWKDGDDIYFLGIATSGEIAAYVLKEYQLQRVSSAGMTALFTSAKKEGLSFTSSGFVHGGATYYVVTLYHVDASPTPDKIVPDLTVVYNSSTNTWTEWSHSDTTNIPKMPIVGWTFTDSSRVGEGIFSTGQLFSPNGDYIPIDGVSIPLYVTAGYAELGYVTESSTTGSNIPLTIRVDNWDGGTRKWKFMHHLKLMADTVPTDGTTMTIKWSDDNNVTYSTGRTLDVSKSTSKLNRLGKFKSRSFECTYSGADQLRAKSLVGDITLGNV